MTRFLRLATLSLLFVYLPVFGLILFYFLEAPPFHKVAPIDPNLTSEDVLEPLDEGRAILRSFPLRAGFYGEMVNGYRREYVKGPSKAEMARRRALFRSTSYSGDIVFSAVTIRKYPDPIASRVAMINLIQFYTDTGARINPVQGYMHLKTDQLEIFTWVDSVWLISVFARDTAGIVSVAEDFPYLQQRSGNLVPLSLDGERLDTRLILPAIGLLAGLLSWPVVASRVVALRPQGGRQPLPARALEDRLLSLNGPGRRWKIRRLGGDEFVAEWNLDDRTWQGLFGRWGLVRTKAVRLRLDRLRAVVKAVEDRYKVRVIAKNKWRPNADVSIRRRPTVGLDLSDLHVPSKSGGSPNPNPTMDPILTAGRGYDVAAIKREIVDAVLNAGWAYQPVLFMRWS